MTQVKNDPMASFRLSFLVKFQDVSILVQLRVSQIGDPSLRISRFASSFRLQSVLIMATTGGPLAVSLSKTAREFESLLRSSERRPLDEFLEAPKLGSSIPLMADLFKRAGVQSRAELESAVKEHFRETEVF